MKLGISGCINLEPYTEWVLNICLLNQWLGNFLVKCELFLTLNLSKDISIFNELLISLNEFPSHRKSGNKENR